jgi:hypothetical protein
MGQDKIKPMTVLGTPFKVQIPLLEHWLLTCPRTLQSRELIWFTSGSKMAGVHGVKPTRRRSFSLGVHVTLLQAETFKILACTRDYIERNCKMEQTHVF